MPSNLWRSREKEWGVMELEFAQKKAASRDCFVFRCMLCAVLLAVVLHARGSEPGQSMTFYGTLPAEELLYGERVTAAGVFEA